MLDPKDPDGAEVAKKLAENSYDTVILQDNSLRTLKDPDGFFSSVAEFCERIRTRGASPLLYMTWARKQGSKTLEEMNITPEEMTKTISKAYRRAADLHKIPIAPVGEAFYEIVTSYPEIELYNPDLTHPSLLGTYLAAMCIFATLTNRTPTELPLPCLEPEMAKHLAQAAARACLR